MTASEHPDLRRNETFARNAAFLPAPLRRRILEADPEEIRSGIAVARSEDGHPVCSMAEGGRTFRINSLRPQDQAKRWCGQIPFGEVGALFVYGCGFGYPLLEIAERKDPDTLVLVFERSLPLFAAMLAHVDLEPVFRTGKFAFFVGRPDSFSPEFARLISQPELFFLTAPTLAFAPEARLFKREYVQIHARALELLALQTKKIGNDHYDSVLGFRQTIANLPEVLENPYASCLKDKFKGVPAFIIANGPSLDKDIPELKRAVGKALILCSESAIAPLMKNGIVPDAICVSERSEKSYRRHFERDRYPEKLALLGLSVIDPRIFASFEGPKIPIFRRFDSDSRLVNGAIGDGSAFFGGRSSAHLAFEAAVYMGANPVVLVGQDLAYGPGGETHSRQSVYAEASQRETVERIKASPDVYLRGNDGRTVRSNAKWNHFKLIFAEMIKENPHVAVLNATEAGAVIKGAKYVPLGRAIDAYCARDLPVALHEVVRDAKRAVDVASRKRRLGTLQVELEKYAAIYDALDSFCARQQERCERRIGGPEAGPDSVSASQGERRGESADFALEALPLFLDPHLHMTYFQQALFAGLHPLNELGPARSREKRDASLGMQAELFGWLGLVCRSLASHFRDAAGSIRSWRDGMPPE